MKEHYFDHKTSLANTLPAGWVWIDFYDGSGHLESPKGESFYHYDVTSYPGNVEWRKTANNAWNIFWDKLSEFKNFAENSMKEELEEQQKTRPLNIVYELRNKKSRDNRSLLDRAADEIERLQSEKNKQNEIIARLEGEKDKLREQLIETRAELQEARGETPW